MWTGKEKDDVKVPRKFKYSGSFITKKCNCDDTINAKIETGNNNRQLKHCMTSNEMNERHKKELSTIMVE